MAHACMRAWAGRGAVRQQYVRPHHRRGVAAAAAARPRLRRARAAAAPRDEGRARRDALPHSRVVGASHHPQVSSDRLLHPGEEEDGSCSPDGIDPAFLEALQPLQRGEEGEGEGEGRRSGGGASPGGAVPGRPRSHGDVCGGGRGRGREPAQAAHALRGGARAGAGAPVPLPRVRRQWQRQGFVGAHTTARSVPPRHAASSTVRISMITACCIGWGRAGGWVTAGATAPLLQEPRQGGARRGAR